MSEQLTPDICVIGGGPGGIAAARAAVAEGVSVVLVEKGATGGSDLAGGSVPAQALRTAAATYRALGDGPAMGVSAAPLQVALPRLRDHIVAVSEAVARNVSPERLAVLGIKVVHGLGHFLDHRTLAVGETVIRARRFILAIGARPMKPAIAGIENVDTMTFAEAFELRGKPQHLIVLGAGPHALGVAQSYNRLGIDATVLSDGAALPGVDPELAAIVVRQLEVEGVRFRTGAAISSAQRRRGGVRFVVVDPESGEEFAVDGTHVLVAGDCGPAIEGVGLDAAGIEAGPGGISVNRVGLTSNRRVYAIGDAVAGASSVARAEQEAVTAVRHALFRVARGASGAAPIAIYTDPALASVGLGEDEARARHKRIGVFRFPFAENERAAAERDAAGIVKVVTDSSGGVLGAAIVGRGAEELIALWSLAVQRRENLAAMAALPLSHPTRGAVARRVAQAALAAGLTSPWRQRIIAAVRKLG